MNSKFPQFEPLHLVDTPLKISLEKYDEATTLLIKHWSSLKQKPISIYQIGQVASPGISDLDFILVFEETKPIDWIQYQPVNFPYWVRELFTHPPYFTTINTWKDLQGWHPTFNMRLLWGKELPKPKTTKEVDQGLALGMLIDYLTVKMPVDLIRLGQESKIRVRVLLCIIHSSKYTFTLAQNAGMPVVPEAEAFIHEVSSFRSNWFDYNLSVQAPALIDLWNKSCLLIAEQIDLIDQFLKEEPFINGPQALGGKDSVFTFIHDFKGRESMQRILSTPSEQPSEVWKNPASFLKVFKIYADTEPHFNLYFKKLGLDFSNGLENTKWEKGLRYHAHIMIQSRVELSKMGIPSQKYLSLGCIPLNKATQIKNRFQIIFKEKCFINKLLRKIKFFLRLSNG